MEYLKDYYDSVYYDQNDANIVLNEVESIIDEFVKRLTKNQVGFKILYKDNQKSFNLYYIEESQTINSISFVMKTKISIFYDGNNIKDFILHPSNIGSIVKSLLDNFVYYNIRSKIARLVPLYADEHGFFHNVNNLIQAFYDTEKDTINPNKTRIVPAWENTPYYNFNNYEKRKDNVFKSIFKVDEYYENDVYYVKKHQITPYPNTWDREDSIITPRFYYKNVKVLGLPNRREANKIINKYLHFTECHVQRSNYGSKYSNYIGIHIRGVGKKDGGVAGISSILDWKIPPLEQYYAIIDDFINKGEKNFYLATDDSNIFSTVKEKYKKINIENMSISKIPGGEPHYHDTSGLIINDLIYETIILSQCKHLIHGISNMANYILSMNLDLGSTDVYAPIRKDMIAK